MMTNEQAREQFNRMIARTLDQDRIAGLEIAREYFTNPEFRKALEQATWDANNAR